MHSLRRHASSVLRGWDLYCGVMAGGIAVLAANSGEVRKAGVTVLLAEAAIGIAVMGMVLTALSVFAAFFDGHYRRILEAAGGVSRAAQPYLITAAIGAGATIISLLVALAWPALGPDARIGLLGATTLLTVWAIGGTVTIVSTTVFHASQRAELMRNIEDAETLRARRLTEHEVS